FCCSSCWRVRISPGSTASATVLRVVSAAVSCNSGSRRTSTSPIGGAAVGTISRGLRDSFGSWYTAIGRGRIGNEGGGATATGAGAGGGGGSGAAAGAAAAGELMTVGSGKDSLRQETGIS